MAAPPSTPPTSPGPARRGPPTAIAVLGLVLLALAARAPRAGESLWYDEIAAWRDYGRLGPVAALTQYHDPANHVLQTALSALTLPALGGLLGDEVALRLPVLLASLALAPALAWVALVAGASRRAALVAGAAAALAPVAVLSGVEARGYAFMMLSAALATGALLRHLERPGAANVGAYAAATVLGTWAHPVTACVAVGHLLVCALAGRWRAGLVAVAAAGATSLAAWSPLLPGLRRVARGFEQGTGTAQPTLLGPEGLHGLLQLGGSWAWWAALPGLVLCAIALAGVVPRRDRTGLAVRLLLGGLPVLVAIVAVAGTWTYARFALFAVPGALLAAAVALDGLASSRRRAGPLLAGLLGGAAVLGWTIDLALRPPKQPLRAAARAVADADPPLAPGELVVVGLRHEVLETYLPPAMGARFALFHGETLPALLAERPSRLVVVLYPERLHPAAAAELDRRGYRLVRRFEGWVDWTNGDVLVYRGPDPPGDADQS